LGKGLLTEEEANTVNAFVVDQLRQAGIRITAVYCCPHRREEGCACIKPNPLFLERAAAEYWLDLHRSFVVGDHPHDVELADNVGASGIYVLTGHGVKHRKELPPGRTVVPGIREAAAWILQCLEMRRQEQVHPGLLDTAAGILRNGGIVAFPTETVYGLGAMVFDEKAIAHVFEAKQRPHFDPLIVHVSGLDQLLLLTRNVPASAQLLIEHFWPGPLTIILPKLQGVSDLVTAGLGTVAVRMPRHPLALELIRRTGSPLAAPSANPFGRTSPTKAQHVLDYLAGKVDMVIDGGACPVGVESTIVSFVSGLPVLLRPGGLPLEEIEALIGQLAKIPANGNPLVLAPGMLPRHYAPSTPLRVVREMSDLTPVPGEKTGILALKRMEGLESFAAVEFLSTNGDLREAAGNLFGAMRKLDALGLDMLIAELAPNIGLGVAINDRLLRAAEKQGTGATNR
jgi:L-threonylcarbamoyladenylate synthase